MKKYKFKEKEIVNIVNYDLTKYSHCEFDYKICIIRKRKIIDGLPHYQLSQQESIYSSGIENLEYSEYTSSTVIFDKKIFDVGFRNAPRIDNWLQEDKILKLEDIKHMEVCPTYEGCELINSFLEEEKFIPDNEKTKKEIEELEKQVRIKNIEIQILKDIFTESINKLEQEQNNYLYQKACLEGDEYLMKEYLLDAII